MRHARSLGFDALEARKLLSTAHPAVHAKRAEVVPVPLVLSGTLAVDHQATTTIDNADGSMTNQTPVSGTLGTLGKVRGNWDESTDAYGNYLGPDTIQLQNTKGSFTLVFNNENLGKAHPVAHGAAYNPIAERARGGTGVFARETQTGSIVLVTNAARTAIQSLTLSTTGS